MIEFSDITKEELNPENYSDQKKYALGILEENIRGAQRKFQDETEKVNEMRDFHNRGLIYMRKVENCQER